MIGAKAGDVFMRQSMNTCVQKCAKRVRPVPDMFEGNRKALRVVALTKIALAEQTAFARSP